MGKRRADLRDQFFVGKDARFKIFKIFQIFKFFKIFKNFQKKFSKFSKKFEILKIFNFFLKIFKHWGRGQWALTGLIHTHMQIAADPGQVFI